jgi:hypothetical protein
MSNEKNLIPTTERTPEERAELGRKGGIASGEARREKRKTLDLLETILASKVTTDDGLTMSREEWYIFNVIKQSTKRGTVDLLELTAKLRGEMINKSEIDTNGSLPIVLTEAYTGDDDTPTEKPKRVRRKKK